MREQVTIRRKEINKKKLKKNKSMFDILYFENMEDS